MGNEFHFRFQGALFQYCAGGSPHLSQAFFKIRPDCLRCAAVGPISRSSCMAAFLEWMRTYPDLLQASGVLGSMLYIGGFALVQTGRICGNGPYYSCNQLTAASLVLISLVGAFNLGAFLIQIGFLIFGSIGLVRRIRLRQTGRYPAGTGVVRRMSDVTSAPPPRDDERETCGWERHPPAPANDRPARPCRAAAAPAP